MRSILFLSLILWGLLQVAPAEHTHEEIYGTIKSLIYSYNQLDNKLERHEHRERALGELMKKAMQALQKGQKNLEPISGIFGRLDERVSQIETMLIAQEDKYNIQSEKLTESLSSMFNWMRENDECYKRPPVSGNSPNTPQVDSEFVRKQEAINSEMLEQLKKLSENVEKLLDTSKTVKQQTEVAYNQIPVTEEKLHKIQKHLMSKDSTNNEKLEQKISEMLGNMESKISDIAAAPKNNEGLHQNDLKFIEQQNDEILQALENVKVETVSATDRALAKTASQLKETEANLESSFSKALSGIGDSSGGDHNAELITQMNNTFNKMNESLEIFNKFNNILMTNSEYVLDTQRKVEFGTLQVVQRISDHLDNLRKDLQKRFDIIEDAIASNQTDTIQNVTAQISQEVELIWRQMSLMQDDVTDSKELMHLLNGRHEGYVNVTFSTMESMGQKVGGIKDRLIDMESNLNFLLGKLSVMAQEFANIKVGVAESLEELRNTFNKMSDKVPVGPGPHNIARNKYETEVNLLQKRHAPHSIQN